MPYPAAAIANEFIRLAKEANRPLSPMKVQKLVYFAHGWYLALTGQPLINEPVEAWRFGPVIPSLYHRLKEYGNREINEFVPDDPWDFFLGTDYTVHPQLIDDGPDPEENEQAKQIVRRIWDVYGGFTAAQLSNMTHGRDDPWTNTPEKEKKHAVIDQEKIRAYFLGLLEQNRARNQAVQQDVG